MLLNYLKVGWRVLARRPFFTFISLFGISLTLAVLMMATAILENEFTARQPESRFDRVLTLQRISLDGERYSMSGGPGYKFLSNYLKDLEGAERTSIFSGSNRTALYLGSQKLETHLRRTDGNYWQILDFQFVEGGPFTTVDDEQARQVAVITEPLRERLFPGQQGLGKTIDISGQTFRVVGVVPAVPITRRFAFAEMWVPLRTARSRDYEQQWLGDFRGIVLARSRGDFDALRSTFQQGLASFVHEDPSRYERVEAVLDTPFEAVARNLVPPAAGRDRATVLRAVLLLAAILFVTLPTMNLVSINLSRIMERASEIGVRKAFGASSRSLVGQFVIENVLLTLIGGVIGFGLTVLALWSLERSEVIPYAIFTVNLKIFVYAIGIAALFGVISGAYPAWRMSRMQAVEGLTGGAA